MTVFESYVHGKLLWENLNAEVRAEWAAARWVTERGGVLDEGFVANEIQTVDAHILELGADTTIGGYVMPKGTQFAMVWFNRDHKERRNWYYTLVTGVKQEDGSVQEIKFNLSYSPRHVILTRKLPIDTEKDLC